MMTSCSNGLMQSVLRTSFLDNLSRYILHELYLGCQKELELRGALIALS